MRLVLHWLFLAALCLVAYGSSVAPYDDGVYHEQRQLKIMTHALCSGSEQEDACRGCFFRLSTAAQEPDFTDSYPNCAHHLPTDVAEKCGAALKETVEGRNVTGICKFEQCVRGIYHEKLMVPCIEKAESEAEDKVQVFKRAAKCILCKAHCLDRKFRQQFDYEPRTPLLAITDRYNMIFTVNNYPGADPILCSNYRTGLEESAIQACECKDNAELMLKPLKKMIHALCSENRDKDACYGCFTRLSTEILVDDATVIPNCLHHLSSTMLEKCGPILKESIEGKNGTGLCDLEQCALGVYNEKLISSCIDNVEKEKNTKVEQFSKTAACFLCKAHCWDLKYKVEFDYGPRQATLMVTEEGSVMTTLLSYSINKDQMCFSSNTPIEEVTTHPCDCTIYEF